MRSKLFRLVAFLLVSLALPAAAQEPPLLKSAVVVLTDDPTLRASVEERLVEVARANDYSAVTSYDFAPDIDRVDHRSFMRLLESEGVGALLMLRPAAVGPDSSLESVRNEVSPDMYERMREFAGEVSEVDSDHLIAVVHMGIYAIGNGDATPLASGAVWLDEEVESRDQGIDRLLGLVLDRVNAVRPAIRRHLGLPPLN